MPDVLFTGYEPSTQRVVVAYGSLRDFRPSFWNRRRGYSCVNVVWDDGYEEEICIDLKLVWSRMREGRDLRRVVRDVIGEVLSVKGVVEVVSPA